MSGLDATHAADRAADDLAFDPLPRSPYVVASRADIRVAVRYSEPLSLLLRALPGAEWVPELRIWRLPITARRVMEAIWDQLHVLADAAQAAPEEEERARVLETAARAVRDREHQARTAKDRLRHGGRPRPLRHEFLAPAPGRPRSALALEVIEDRSAAASGSRSERPWVAQIFGSDGRGGFNRSSLAGGSDYSGSNSKGSRGVIRHFALEEGLVYEVNERVSWKRTDRYFLRIEDGQHVRMTAEEVWQCVES